MSHEDTPPVADDGAEQPPAEQVDDPPAKQVETPETPETPATPTAQPTFTLRNNTARRIAIDSTEPDGTGQAGLIVAPFVTLVLSQAVVAELVLEPWLRRGLVTLTQVSEQRAPTPAQLFRRRLAAVVPALPIVGGAAYFGFIILREQRPLQELDLTGYLTPTVLIVAGLVITLVIAFVAERFFNVHVLGSAQKAAEVIARPFGAVMLLLPPLVLLVLLLPAIGLASVVGLPFALNVNTVLNPVVQVVFMAIAALAPAYPYFIFQARKVDELRAAFTHDVMMLDPSVLTEDEASSRYRQQVDAVYGTGAWRSGVFGSNLPVLLTTILVLIGWLLTLPVTNPLDNPLMPQRTVLVFGFLGAYFFVLNMVFRRYVRNDLSVKTYNYALVRILVALVSVWVATAVVQGEPIGLLAAAFFIGLVPDTGIAIAQDVAKRGFAQIADVLRQERPLSELRGMNIYDQARFLEEGIEDIENLAHYDLIPLMLRMRMPAPRLIELVDQAILSLHLSNDAVSRKSEVERLSTALGVSTATGLEAAARKAKAAGRREYERFSTLLKSDRPQDKDDPRRMLFLLDQIGNELWMPYLRQWRDTRADGCSKVWRLADFYPPTSPAVEVPGAELRNGHELTAEPPVLSPPLAQAEASSA